MTSKIAENMKELKNITDEIKRITYQVKELRERKNELESSILTYMIDNDQPGFKYRDMIVKRGETKTRARRKRREKEEEIMKVLSESGISDTKKTLEEILKAMSGEQSVKPKLKIQESLPEIRD